MAQDFESEFNNIINNNDFTDMSEENEEEQELALDEVAHVLETINESSMIIAGVISEALETKTPLALPKAAVAIFHALHALHEEFITTMTTECDCDECKDDEDE
jgi:broad-specificity NMP kinase